jgi:hypothetical protein
MLITNQLLYQLSYTGKPRYVMLFFKQRDPNQRSAGSESH